MSNFVLSWAWLQSIEDPSAKLVLIKLADMANDDGTCWPSQSTLANHCGLNERSIRYKLSQLRDLGLLSIEQRHDGKSRQSNIYHLASGKPLPVGLPANPTGNRLPQNHHLEPSEPSIGEPTGNPLPLACKTCGLEFKTKATLIDHLRNVEGEDIPLEEEESPLPPPPLKPKRPVRRAA